jgi:hypothetical protein
MAGRVLSPMSAKGQKRKLGYGARDAPARSYFSLVFIRQQDIAPINATFSSRMPFPVIFATHDPLP